MADDDEVVRKPLLRQKWLQPNHDTKRRSNKNEARLAKALGGKRVRNSGGKPWSRADASTVVGTGPVTEGGDLSTADFFIENKRSEKKSISVQKEWIDGIKESAKRTGKYPAVILTYETPRKPPEDWVMIPIDVFDRLRKNHDS
jgi:hypothetical protein